MKMPESSSSIVDSDDVALRNGQLAGNTKSDLDSANELTEDPSPLPLTSDSADSKPVITKPPSARLPAENGDGQSPLRSPYHNLYSASTSRNSSARTSTSSLQALNEDIVVDVRSERRPTMPRRASSGLNQSGSHSPAPDYPVYPDQSYASLQTQVHPTYQPPLVGSRNSFQSHHDIRARLAQSRAARAAGSPGLPSPGLFSFDKTTRPSSALGIEEGTRSSSPFLHPTHLQPPKE